VEGRCGCATYGSYWVHVTALALHAIVSEAGARAFEPHAVFIAMVVNWARMGLFVSVHEAASHSGVLAAAVNYLEPGQ